MGKSTISMAIFNSKLLNYQRVYDSSVYHPNLGVVNIPRNGFVIGIPYGIPRKFWDDFYHDPPVMVGEWDHVWHWNFTTLEEYFFLLK